MGLLNTITEFIYKIFQWWFLVMPWEQAIHVRRGKNVKLREKGLYFRIPFIDSVYVQTTRMRMIETSMQTLTAKDGNTLTLKSAVGYTITDIMKLYYTLYHPEMTLTSMIMGYIADYIRENTLENISPNNIQNHVIEKIPVSDYGLTGLSIKITTFAIVKTFRLIQDGSYLSEGLNMNAIK